MLYKQGVAVSNYPFSLKEADGTAVTTGTTTGVMTKDGVQGATLANATHVGNGVWNISFTASEMDAISLHFLPINSLAVTLGAKIPTYTQLDSNLIQINGSTLPVNNLENMMNGVGYVADTAPAQQQQLDNIAIGTAGISEFAQSATITVGDQGATSYLDTQQKDGVFHIVQDVAGDTDFTYFCNIGSGGVPIGFSWAGYVQGNGSNVSFQAWDFVSSSWNIRETVTGNNSIVEKNISPKLTPSMVGTGVNEGEVRLRLLSSTTSAIATDEILFEYSQAQDTGFVIREGFAQGGTTQTVTLDAGASPIDGFYIHDAVIFPSGTGAGEGGICVDYNGTNKELTFKEPLTIAPDATTKFKILFGQTHSATTSGGYDSAKVYINGATGQAGTTKEVNGIISNPVDNMPDARTIADLVNIKTLSFSGGAALALDQSYIDFKFEFTQGQLFDLNGQDVGGSAFLKSGITGNMIASKRVNFELCGLFDCSLGLSSLLQSGIAGTITLANNDRYQFDQCFANDPSITPTININGNGTIQTLLYLNDYKGTAIISNLTSSDYIEANGNMRLILDSTCNGGIISKNGNVFIEDDSTVSPTFICGLACDTNEAIKLLPTAAQIDAELSANHGPGSWETADISTLGTLANQTIINDNVLTRLSTTDYTSTSLVVDGKLDAIIADTNELQTNQGNWVTADISGLPTTAEFEARTLLSAEYSQFNSSTDSVTINQSSADLVLSSGNVDGYSLEQSQRLILSANTGKLSGAATSNIVIRNAADTKARITATVDQDGNRVSTTLDAS